MLVVPWPLIIVAPAGTVQVYKFTAGIAATTYTAFSPVPIKKQGFEGPDTLPILKTGITWTIISLDSAVIPVTQLVFAVKRQVMVSLLINPVPVKC